MKSADMANNEQSSQLNYKTEEHSSHVLCANRANWAKIKKFPIEKAFKRNLKQCENNFKQKLIIQWQTTVHIRNRNIKNNK